MKHIILIGFKHVGKSTIAKLLAVALSRAHLDTDAIIEERHAQEHGLPLSCREIMLAVGEEKFRVLEREALASVLQTAAPLVISVGGGAPLDPDNQTGLKEHIVVHVTGSKGTVYERIMLNGRPAFFPAGENAFGAFQKLWNERRSAYESLASVTIDNNATPDEAVERLKLIITANSLA